MYNAVNFSGKDMLVVYTGFFYSFFYSSSSSESRYVDKTSAWTQENSSLGKKSNNNNNNKTFRESNVWGGLGRVAGMELKDNFCPWVKLGTLQIDRKYSDCHSCQLGNTRNRDHIAARLWGQIYTILASTESMTCTSTSCFTLTATEQRGRHSNSRDKSKLPVQTSMW